MKVVKNWSTHFLRFLHHPVYEEPDESCVKVRVDVSNLLPSESPMSAWKWQVSSNEGNPKQKLFLREGTWIKDLWMIKTVVLFGGNLVAKSCMYSSDKKKYCLLVDSPDKTSTPTVDLPASAHLKTFGRWIFIEDQPDSDNYQQIIIEDQPDYYQVINQILKIITNATISVPNTTNSHPPLSRLNKHQ